VLRNGKRKFFDLARLIEAPLAAKGGQAYRCLFAIEREINGLPWRGERFVLDEEQLPPRDQVNSPSRWVRLWFIQKTVRLTVHSIPSVPNVRSNRPCNMCGIDFSRNSEPKPRRAGLCAIGLARSRQRSRNSFSLPRS